jgi:hypothetical protein
MSESTPLSEPNGSAGQALPLGDTPPSPPGLPNAHPDSVAETAEAARQEANAYVIEVRGQTAGIVARDGRGFRFHASAHRFNGLDGQRFGTPREAEKAALALAQPGARNRRAAAPGRRLAFALG